MEAEIAPFAPVPAALVATERRVEIEPAIDADPARAHPPRDRAALVEVATVHITGEAESGIVGDLDRMVNIIIADDHQHRPEDLLACNDHVVGAGKHGGLHEPALVDPVRAAEPAGDQSRPL